MSIDVEDWFQVENMRRAVPVDTWKLRRLRAEQTMDRMLALMAERDVKATCFFLGSFAERAPALVGRVADAGHEIASHGYGHRLLGELTPAEFRADVERSKALLEDITGLPVRGYRAPCFSITDWAIRILQDCGFAYDSSLCATTIPGTRYGMLADLQPRGGGLIASDGFTEVSLPCLMVGAHALPWAGGGYFRLLPYRVFRAGVTRILAAGTPYVFYIHPWELDPGQPRVTGLSRSERMRHYLNLERTEDRWSQLLLDFRWTTIAQLLGAAERENAGCGRCA